MVRMRRYSPGPNNSPWNRWPVPVGASDPTRIREQPNGTLPFHDRAHLPLTVRSTRYRLRKVTATYNEAVIRLQVQQPAAAQHPLDVGATSARCWDPWFLRKVSTTYNEAVIRPQVPQPAAAQHPLDVGTLGSYQGFHHVQRSRDTTASTATRSRPASARC